MFQVSKEEKELLGHKAVEKVLSGLEEKETLNDLILEFDEGKTKEAKFAYFCDKLECDLQSRIYGELGCVDLKNQEGNNIMNNDIVKRLLNSGMSWSEMWLNFSQEVYHYDDNFKAVSDYVLTHKLIINTKK